MLPINTPAEVLQISPEALEVANIYLQEQDISKTADILDISSALVSQYLERREVKSYIDQVFYNVGFNNKFQVRKLMDTIIKKKLQDMDEAEVGSTKDIADLLELSHKMTMEHMNKEIQLEKLRGSHIKNQTNIQINEGSGQTKYANLIEKLLTHESV